MGHVYVKAILSNPFVDGLVAEAEALVDTGATFSVVPRSLAESLQLPITGRRRVRTATGEIEVDRGTALIQLNGQRASELKTGGHITERQTPLEGPACRRSTPK